MAPAKAIAWLFAACCVFASPCALSQDSVGALLERAERVKSSEPDQFRDLLRQLDASQDRATPAQREHLRYLNAYALVISGRHDIAIPEAVDLAEGASTVEMRYRAGSLAVNSMAIAREFTEGLRLLERTLDLAPQIQDPELRVHGLMVAAQIYNQMGQYALGVEYAERILAEPMPTRTLCFAGQHRLEALHHLQSLPSDDDILALEARCSRAGEDMVAALVRHTLASKWAAEGRVGEGLALLRRNVAAVEATRYPTLIREMQALMADLSWRNGEIQAAERHAVAALDRDGGVPESRTEMAAYWVLYEIARERGDYAGALEQYRRFAEAQKNFADDVKVRELAYQIVRQETAQQEQQIALLDQQNQVLRLRQQVGEQAAQNTRLLIALLLVLLASIAYWAWRVTRRHHSLRLLAEVDALTGVSNRRHFLLQAEQCLEQSARTGDPVSLVMFDLDYFKQINDTYGHVTGDWVLERVAAECRSLCRRVDLFGRLGGEEFAILLPGCDVEAAARVSEQCRARIASIDTAATGHGFPLAASFGVTDSTWSGHVLSRLLSHADQALYRAKHGGRNLVCVYAGEPVRTRPPVTPPAGFASQPT